MAETTKEHSTPIIFLTPDERKMLRDAWENTKDKLSLVALQNDDELRHLQNVTNDVKTVRRMTEEERQERDTWIAAIKRGVLQILGAVGWVQK